MVTSFKTRKNAEEVRPIFLYEIQYDKVGNQWLYYCNWPENIVFDGITYTRFPITHNRISENLAGKVDKVNLRIGNADRQIQYYLENWSGLRDAEVRIKMVWQEEINDPTCFDENVFAIADSTSGDEEAMFVLASKMDVLDIRLPRRKYYRTYCTFIFKGEGCAYSGAEATCNHTLQRCIEIGNVHRFGGCPAIPEKTVYI